MANTTTPLAETLGYLAYHFNELYPFIPMSTHLILSALFPIYTGAHSSLSRPSSALKPPKKKKTKHTTESSASSSEDEDDEDSLLGKMEGLSPSDAVVFPLLAGSTLAGLYFLIKYIGPEMINKILGWYFSAMAVFSVGKLVDDGLAVIGSFVLPDYYVSGRSLWVVKQSDRRARQVDEDEMQRKSPLPGFWGAIALPESLEGALWSLRGAMSQKYQVKGHFRKLFAVKFKVTLRTMISAAFALGALSYANFVSTPWYLTNLQGFAFSYTALQLMSPTTFATGSLILIALFFYDIYFVFYTPMMITVAGNLDVPIKLLFPRPEDESGKRSLAMLGLGDIVLPGIMIGLALRFDLYMQYLRKQTKKVDGNKSSEESTTKDAHMVKQPYRSVTGHWGDRFWSTSVPGLGRIDTSSYLPSFPKPYFAAAVCGYVLGMVFTLVIMLVFKHGQPALLYLVPGVLGSLWLTGLIRGEIKEMWEFSEAIDASAEDEEDEKKDEKAKENENKQEETSTWKEWFGKSFFSTESSEKNAKRLEKRLAKNLKQDSNKSDDSDKSTASKDDDTKSTAEAKKESEGAKSLFSFSIHKVPTKARRKSARVSSASTADADAATSTATGVASNGQVPQWRGHNRADVDEDIVGRAGKRVRVS
ncbi:hypothetical protein MBLNU457_3391t1 [Dothideomycetes sp. NU457]